MSQAPSNEYIERARALGPELEAAADEIERVRELQQYQGRQAHFATVGQVLLGLPPQGTMFTF